MKRLPGWNVGSKSGRERMRSNRMGHAGDSTGREQTALIKLFKAGAMTTRQTTADSVLGPYHESKLPRRPPCHWLRPPRKSVVNAPPPWRAPDAGRISSAGRTAPGDQARSVIGARFRRACDTVVRFANGYRRLIEGTHPACHCWHRGGNPLPLPRCLRSSNLSAENRRPAGAGQKSLGTLLPHSRRR